MLPLGKYKYIFMLCKLALEDNDVSKKQPSSKAKQISNNSQGHLVELLPRNPPCISFRRGLKWRLHRFPSMCIYFLSLNNRK